MNKTGIKIVYCKECIYYDEPHVEKDGRRYNYKDMQREAFDPITESLVSAEHGINVGGRCCVDFNVGYSEDKRVFVKEDNYCGRGKRQTHE